MMHQRTDEEDRGELVALVNRLMRENQQLRAFFVAFICDQTGLSYRKAIERLSVIMGETE